MSAAGKRPPQSGEVHSKALRRALGSFATGVAVITTHHDGADRGITVNSFTSVSLDPPLVLWCLARTSRTLQAFTACDEFAINILAADQVEISNRFAFRSDDAFPQDISCTRSANNVPLLDGVSASFTCRRHSVMDGGDHLIVVGEVTAFSSADRPGLVYSRGKYAIAHTHPQTLAKSSAEGDEGFLEAMVRPTLDALTQQFESLFEAELAAEGVNPREAQVLGLLVPDKSFNTEEIANRTLVSGSFLEETLESLVGKGLLLEEWDCYSLTESGKSLATGWQERLREYRRKALGSLPRKDTRELQATLRRLSDWVDSAEPSA